MLRILAITTLILAGASAVAYADVYRWVDDHGGVHYTDRWVPGSEVIKSTKPHPVANNDSYAAHHPEDKGKLSASNDHAADVLNQQNAAQAVKQDVAKVREQQCKEAKDRYDKSVTARRIFKTPKDGAKAKDPESQDDRQYLSDEEADAYRVRARTDMQQYCGSSAK